MANLAQIRLSLGIVIGIVMVMLVAIRTAGHGNARGQLAGAQLEQEPSVW